MFKNYFTIAIRNISRNKLFSFINIFGLAMSMSICLIAIMTIKDQFSYDTFHLHAERIYRINTEFTNPDGDHFELASSPLPLQSIFQKDYALAQQMVRLYPALQGKASTAAKELQINGTFADASFFQVFGFTLEQGNPLTALDAPNRIVISKETAIKFFGSQNPIGQMLTFKELGSFQVSGVMKEAPGHSHLEFDTYASMSSVPLLEKTGKLTPRLNQWDSYMQGYTYVLIKKTANKPQLKAALTQISDRLNKESGSKSSGYIAFGVQSLGSITPGFGLYNELSRGATWNMIFTVIGITFIILLSACFNYTNLSIARSLNRAKEVGIRKVAGAFRYQIFMQFMAESILVSLLALGFAFVFLRLMMDYAPFRHEIIPDIPISADLLISFLLFSVCAGAIAGALPAWVLSSLEPVRVLKNLSTLKLFGSINLRKSLIVVQFVLSMVITIFLTVIYRQFNYMATADTGFRQENILTIPLQGVEYKALRTDLQNLAGVEYVSATSATLGKHVSGTTSLQITKQATPIEVNYYFVDEDFIATMDLKLLTGNTFAIQTANNSTEKAIVVNEKALEALQLPLGQAIGQQVWMNDTTQVTIAGVIRDFHYQPMGSPIRPMMLRYRPSAFAYIQVQVNPLQAESLVPQIKHIWQTHNRLVPFAFSWLQEDLYENRAAWGTVSLLGFLSFMTITIAWLGLLGMVTYTAQVRQKEISIRKVMGASEWKLVVLLSKGFLKLLLFAGMIAIPIGYVSGYIFLNNFAYRVSVGLEVILLSFLALLSIALVAIGSQTYKVASSNPANILRNE
ncbi:FtsX-like permease family protein [Rhodocytophaga rosea]|uniref:FtsX-like permease family protein n=1 Tax=Rhodocytophaga rosea TaxID=2704465 RepID=A0A6C0GQU6_9BACT|nr:ABC transporter permease [Rhodocytophaga rosea]QHT70431.1 FtsX-like permease family protein [Rhodocytophaga rosea]